MQIKDQMTAEEIIKYMYDLLNDVKLYIFFLKPDVFFQGLNKLCY